SDEAIKSGNKQLADHASNGHATGFTAKGKTFTKFHGFSSSAAVRAFIGGGITVCECEGLLHAVMFNALVDVCGPIIFDLVFPVITLSCSKGSTKAAVLRVVDHIAQITEDKILQGDWVYVMTTNWGMFAEASSQSRKGMAGGGWNLICTAPKKYIGFGINKK